MLEVRENQSEWLLPWESRTNGRRRRVVLELFASFFQEKKKSKKPLNIIKIIVQAEFVRHELREKKNRIRSSFSLS